MGTLHQCPPMPCQDNFSCLFSSFLLNSLLPTLCINPHVFACLILHTLFFVAHGICLVDFPLSVPLPPSLCSLCPNTPLSQPLGYVTSASGTKSCKACSCKARCWRKFGIVQGKGIARQHCQNLCARSCCTAQAVLFGLSSVSVF